MIFEIILKWRKIWLSFITLHIFNLAYFLFININKKTRANTGFQEKKVEIP